MRRLKTSISTAIMLAMTLIWVGCQKEESNQNLENQEEFTNQRVSGVVSDDPLQVGKVPLIISSEYLKNGQNSPANDQILISGRGKRDIISPTISIAAPTAGSAVSGKVTVLVNASDNIAVKSVSLYVDGSTTAVMTNTTAPFSNSWSSASVANGVHTLTVTALDASGNQGKSSVQVNVNNVAGGDITAPTVSITSPADGASFSANTPVNITISASDNVGVSTISLNIDGAQVGTGSGSAYSYSWSTAISGPHTIVAKAFDAAGNQASKSIAVTINTVIINPPSGLPTSFKLTMPPIMNQGGEGSCVSLAVINARSFEQYNRTNASSYSNSINIFSPEFVFNQTKSDVYCSGSALLTALDLLVNKGVCTWTSMPYTSTGCSSLPNGNQLAEATNYKIASYSKILKTDQTAIKTMISSKRALVSTFSIDDNFRNAGIGYIWNSFSVNPGAHALVLCGYDDSKKAYLAVNAWGESYGNAGYIWIDYNFFTTVSSDLFVMNF